MASFRLIAPVWEHANRILVHLQPLSNNVFNYIVYFSCLDILTQIENLCNTTSVTSVCFIFLSRLLTSFTLHNMFNSLPPVFVQPLPIWNTSSYNATTLRPPLSCLLLVKCEAVSSASCSTHTFHFLLASQLTYRPGYYLPPWLIFLGWHSNDYN